MRRGIRELARTCRGDSVVGMTLSAVLLAGGDSRRMGSDKATIIFRGEPLWKRQLDVLRGLHPERIFVSVRKEPPWLPDDTELLLDKSPSRGPLSGLTIALERTQTSHLVALAIDMPFMTSDQMLVLWNQATVGCGVLPMIGDRAEPLAAIYPRETGGDFLAALEGDDFSMQRLSRSLIQGGMIRVFDVPQHDEEFYQNVNEPADFKER